MVQVIDITKIARAQLIVTATTNQLTYTHKTLSTQNRREGPNLEF